MVYTDKIHLVADSVEELHKFATLICLKRHYYEGVRKGHPHYDLTNKYIIEKAIQNGAKIISSRELVGISHKLIHKNELF
ncbi:DUF4031 domain-containing protein [Hyphomicrobium sp.]|uniref:DUF4031 domain-containing protein n=1 Tax=Hyphomicrobium sp. TaxID=82 RepID=UPI0035643BCF